MALTHLGLSTYSRDLATANNERTIVRKINQVIDYFIPFTGAEDTDTDTYGRLRLLDTDASNILSVLWGENDFANRTVNLRVGGGSRTLDLSGNLTVEATSLIDSDLTQDANVTFNKLTLSSIVAEATDVNKFLVSNTGLIKSRTGAQVLSDIGAAEASHAMSTHSDEDSYNLATSGSILSSGTGGLTSGSASNTGKVVIYDGSDHKITITAPSIAGDYALTLPVDNGALGEVMFTDGNGVLSWDTPVGAGDVSAAANITDHAIVRGNGGAKGVQDTGSIINDAGHWGIGTTDIETWHADYQAVEFYAAAMMSKKIDSNLYLMVNTYYDGAWKYKINNPALIYTMSDEVASWRFASTGVANNVATATQNFRISAGLVCIGADSSNTKMTQGLTINQAGYDDEILALKSSDVAHGMTAQTETDTFGTFKKISGASGGLRIYGFSEAAEALYLRAGYTNDNTTKSTAATAPIVLDVHKRSGTSWGAAGANANLVVMREHTSTRWILDEDGDTWQSGAVFADKGGSVAAANMVTGLGVAEFLRSSSSKRNKDKIEDLEIDSSLIYQFQPRSFNSLCIADDKKRRFHGLVAEEIEPYCPEIIIYDEEKKADSYDNQMLMTLFLDQLQRVNKRVEKLEEK